MINTSNIDLSILKPHYKQRMLDFYEIIVSNSLISPVALSLDNTSCPKCSSDWFVKNGKRKDKQRYKCKKCSYSFSSTSLTSIHNLKKVDAWSDLIFLMFYSKIPPTIEELADKLSLSNKTIHIWKHKLLSSLVGLENISLNGEIEMDEVFLPFCVKGKKGDDKTTDILKLEDKLLKNNQNAMFLCIHNRNNDFDFLPIKIQQKGAVKAEVIGSVINKLDIQEGTIVVTDKAKGTAAYFKTRNDVIHETFISSGIKTSILHNNNINNTMSLYKTWSKRFRGYSTKYMWNYLTWFRFHKKFMEFQKLENMVKRSVKDISSSERYTQIPKYYEEFLHTA